LDTGTKGTLLKILCVNSDVTVPESPMTRP